MVAVLSPFLDAEVGRPRHLSLEGLLVALQLNALHRHHQAHLVQAARVLNALTEDQRNSSRDHVVGPGRDLCPRRRLFVTCARCSSPDGANVDATWFANRWPGPPFPKMCSPASRWQSTVPTSKRGGRCGVRRTRSSSTGRRPRRKSLTGESGRKTTKQDEGQGQNGQGLRYR